MKRSYLISAIKISRIFGLTNAECKTAECRMSNLFELWAAASASATFDKYFVFKWEKTH